ncbi:MAG TPA: DNA replication and repair protein RecF, partial [Candidatus Krumholzibacteriaceae bacterium]|nr:DNA replication and repair protein RecF [Candidatus Krumholzibacteriaceae bacterium]
ESDKGVEYILEVGAERSGRTRVKINGEIAGGFSGLIGIIPGVIFTPRDIGMASGPPGDRRSFIDYTAAQIAGDFFGILKGYRQVLKQRNAQIKEIAVGRGRVEVMRALDSMLVERGEEVVRGRRRVLKIIRDRAAEMFRYVFKGDDYLEMKYTSSINAEGGKYSDIFSDYLLKMRDEEIRRGYTIAGPHRDDIVISIGELNLRKYGSQGRKRLVAIVMKMAQASVIYEKRGERPVIMLDDIFSELDREVSGNVREFLSERYQNFITSPEPVRVENREGTRRFFIDGGKIEVQI